MILMFATNIFSFNDTYSICIKSLFCLLNKMGQGHEKIRPLFLNSVWK